MHLSTKRRVVLGISTGGLLVGGLGMGVAQADAAAAGGAAGSPGLLSGNLVQIPINAPVNVCGNSISVIGILDTAAGNTCVNSGSNGASAHGGATDSPGAGSGNLVQIPINAPVNLCGNSASGVGVGDSAVDNTCSNGSGSGGAGGAGANGGSHGSPGVGSGNTVQLPVNAPVNLCGNSVSVVGILDTAADNKCSNTGPGGTGPSHPAPPTCGCHPTPPSTPPSSTGTPPPPPPITTPPPAGGHPHGPVPPYHTSTSGNGTGTVVRPGSLAETGSGAGNLVTPLGAGVLGGTGLMLRRRVSTLHRIGRDKH
jgi:hypothetical protein